MFGAMILERDAPFDFVFVPEEKQSSLMLGFFYIWVW